jgi:hypothetical protein
MKSVFAALAVVSLLVARPIAQTPTPDIVGDWEITTSSPVGESTNTMGISKTADGYAAAAKSERGQVPYDSIKVAGKDITLVLTIDYEGSPMIITYTGTIEDKRMSGGADFGGLAQGSWSATKKAAAAK